MPWPNVLLFLLFYPLHERHLNTQISSLGNLKTKVADHCYCLGFKNIYFYFYIFKNDKISISFLLYSRYRRQVLDLYYCTFIPSTTQWSRYYYSIIISLLRYWNIEKSSNCSKFTKPGVCRVYIFQRALLNPDSKAHFISHNTKLILRLFSHL